MDEKKKLIVRHTGRTEFDVETGEVKRVITEEQIGRVETEPDYIKIYINTQLSLNNIDPSLAPVIIAFGEYMTFANNKKYQHMVRTDKMARDGVAAELGVSTKRVDQLIKRLVEVGIFIPIEVRTVDANGIIKSTKRRGMYFVNPFVVAKGSWSDIKQLRQEIDWVKGMSSYTIDDGSGTHSIQFNDEIFKDYHQISMEEYLGGTEKIDMPHVPYLPTDDNKEE